jgi:crotonobetainyl-CoA:carnitine CoA-transferase CaiB-like acyl-CoA transferase
MTATPATMRRAAPVLGADTAAVLGELGYSAEEIETLKATRVV